MAPLPFICNGDHPLRRIEPPNATAVSNGRGDVPAEGHLCMRVHTRILLAAAVVLVACSSFNSASPSAWVGTPDSGSGGGSGSSGSSGGGGGSCSNVTPCGGNVVGTWAATSSCLTVSGALD